MDTRSFQTMSQEANNPPLSEREKLIQQGYDPKHLIDLPNGKTIYDLDSAQMDSTLKMFEARRKTRKPQV